MTIRALLFAATLAAACAPAPLGPSGLSYRYGLAPSPSVLFVGESLRFEWRPIRDLSGATATADLTLCFALFGPWADVETLKRESQSSRTQSPTCPPTGAAVVSDVVQTTSTAGTTLHAEAPGLSRPGFYNLRQIVLKVEPVQPDRSSRGGSEVSDRVVEVRAR